MSSNLCLDCSHYCVYCQICYNDKEYHDFNDSCKNYAPENPEESEDGE